LTSLQSRDALREEMREELNEAIKDEDMVQTIYDAAKNSMGQDITEADKVAGELISRTC
jgi:RNA processing factor Prp31